MSFKTSVNNQGRSVTQPTLGRHHTQYFDFLSLQSAVFLLNSRGSRFTATSLGFESKSLHLQEAHLLPKLRCQFAEFLHPSSLKRLRILILPTCVGLRYGLRQLKLRGFSWKRGISDFRSVDPGLGARNRGPRICLRSIPTAFPRDNQRPVHLPFSVSPSQSREVLEY